MDALEHYAEGEGLLAASAHMPHGETPERCIELATAHFLASIAATLGTRNHEGRSDGVHPAHWARYLSSQVSPRGTQLRN